MSYDVVVAGAGPVGLMVAGELALRGVRVLVIERLAEPDRTIKAGSITVPTAEAFDRRGLLPQLREAQEQSLAKVREFLGAKATAAAAGAPRIAGHFGGLMLDPARVDLADPRFAGLGEAASVTIVAQPEIEQILAGWVAALGVEIHRGVALKSFGQDPDFVRVELGDGRSERASWLIGTDGGRSVVRKRAGFAFPGTGPQITGHQALAELEHTDGLQLGWHATPTGVYAFGPVPGRILTVEFDGPPADRDTPVDAAELEKSVRHVTGVDVTVRSVRSATRYTDNARQATTYRSGRVLLAGDAAHVHSPFGGQGLNLGIGDAVNLGWKLAAEIHGWAPAGLLDTYTTERHPVGAAVLDWTRAQIAIMRPDPYARALRQVVAHLAATGDGATTLAATIAGLNGRPPVAGPELAAQMHDGRGLLVAATAGHRADRLRSVPGPQPTLVRPDGVLAWTPGAGSLDDAVARWFGA